MSGTAGPTDCYLTPDTFPAYHGPMLILFDIDGTLLLTNRAGLTAMQAATR